MEVQISVVLLKGAELPHYVARCHVGQRRFLK